MAGKDVSHIILNQKNDDTLVQNLVEKFRDAFNRHDPQTIGSLLMEDGEWMIACIPVANVALSCFTNSYSEILTVYSLTIFPASNATLPSSIASEKRIVSLSLYVPGFQSRKTVRYSRHFQPFKFESSVAS